MTEQVQQRMIPVGYKQTEVGVIPEDWDCLTIGDLASVSSGGTPNRKNPDYWDGNIPWVTTALINGKEIWQANETITQQGFENSATKWCEPGTILMAMYGQGKTRGKVGVLQINATINQACAAIAVKGNTSSEFLLHFLNSQYEAIRDLSNSGGQENLSGTIIKNINIPVPQPEEQTAIANALSDTDALLSELEKLIAKKQAIKTATMQQLLTGKVRLPAFSLREDGTKKSLKGSEHGDTPEDWKASLLGDLVHSCTSGATPYRGNPEYYKGHVRWISSGELNYNRIYETIEHISDKAVSETNLKIHPSGTFLIAITGLEAAGTRGSCGIVGSPAATNQSCMAIYPNESLTSEYLYHWYIYHGDKLALKYCQGTKQLSYTARLVKLLPTLIPEDTREQTAIATILSDMDSEIAALQQRLEKTRQLKQGMMQQLLTGKIRLIKPAASDN